MGEGLWGGPLKTGDKERIADWKELMVVGEHRPPQEQQRFGVRKDHPKIY